MGEVVRVAAKVAEADEVKVTEVVTRANAQETAEAQGGRDANIKRLIPPPFGTRRDLEAFATRGTTHEAMIKEVSVNAGRAARVCRASLWGRDAFSSGDSCRSEINYATSSFASSFEMGDSKEAWQQCMPDKVKHYYWPPQLEGRSFIPRQRCHAATPRSPMPAMGNENNDLSPLQQLQKLPVVVNVYNRAERVRRRQEYLP